MENKRLTVDELKTEIDGFLKEHRSGSLATNIGNIPRSSPVQYIVGDDLNLYILSAGGDKFKAIKENPNVCLLVNSDYLDYRKIKGVQVFGKATTSLEDDNLFDEARSHISEKYIIDNEKDGLKVIKIRPEEIVYLDSLLDGDRTKQVLRDNKVYVKMESNIINPS